MEMADIDSNTKFDSITDVVDILNKSAFKDGKIAGPSYDQPFSDRRFVNEVARKIFMHKQYMHPAAAEILQDAKADIEETKKKIINYLKGLGLKDATINAAMLPIEKELEKELAVTPEIKGMFQFGARDIPWIEKENELIKELIDLYNIHTPWKNNEHAIAYNLSIVFDDCGLWPDAKDPFSTMKKRVRIILKKSV
jgi:hypothetical protein